MVPRDLAKFGKDANEWVRRQHRALQPHERLLCVQIVQLDV